MLSVVKPSAPFVIRLLCLGYSMSWLSAAVRLFSWADPHVSWTSKIVCKRLWRSLHWNSVDDVVRCSSWQCRYNHPTKARTRTSYCPPTLAKSDRVAVSLSTVVDAECLLGSNGNWCFALVETGSAAVRAARQQSNKHQQSCRWSLLSLLFPVAVLRTLLWSRSEQQQTK